MSISIYRNNITRIEKELAELKKKASQETEKKAKILQQIISIKQSIGKYTNDSQRISKERQICQLTNDLSRTEKCEADIGKKVFDKNCELNRNQELLTQEVSRQEKKKRDEEHKFNFERNRQQAQELRHLKAITSELQRQSFLQESSILNDFSIYRELSINKPDGLANEIVKAADLEAHRSSAPKLGEQELIALIAQGESAELEFKSTARWNLRENKKDKEIEHEIVKTIAAFLNTDGGTLLIGVNDNGVLIGLQHDYQTLKKKNNDGYALFLNHDLLLRELGKNCGPLFQIFFHQVAGQDVCRVVVQPSPKPVYVKVKDKSSGKEEDCFFIRSSNSSVKLTIREAIEYCLNRWG